MIAGDFFRHAEWIGVATGQCEPVSKIVIFDSEIKLAKADRSLVTCSRFRFVDRVLTIIFG